MTEIYPWPCRPQVTNKNLEDFYLGTFKGKNAHTHDTRNVYHDKEHWHYPPEVEDTIEDETEYRFYGHVSTASDPMDATTHTFVAFVF